MWTPFATFHDVGRTGRAIVADLIQKPFEYVKSGVVRTASNLKICRHSQCFKAAGTAKQSFTADVLTNEDLTPDRKANPDFEDSLKWAVASMYAGTFLLSQNPDQASFSLNLYL